MHCVDVLRSHAFETCLCAAGLEASCWDCNGVAPLFHQINPHQRNLGWHPRGWLSEAGRERHSPDGGFPDSRIRPLLPALFLSLSIPRSSDNSVMVDWSTCEGFQMDEHTPVKVPESLRYDDGLYVFERFARAGAGTSVRDKRIVTRAIRALHWPWFAVWMPTGVAADHDRAQVGKTSDNLRPCIPRRRQGLSCFDYRRACPVAEKHPRELPSDTALPAPDNSWNSS
jgi:hypothetical protein